MRYYKLTLRTDKEQIEKNSRIDLRDYSYNNPINSLNSYMYNNLNCGLSFFIYKEENNSSLLAAFSYDNRHMSFKEAYGGITGSLKQTFGINKISKSPEEITMTDFQNLLLEAKRREFADHFYSRIIDTADLCMFDYRYNYDAHLPFELEEKVIPVQRIEPLYAYDEGFIKELSNIEDHDAQLNARTDIINPVHYVISGRSIGAAADMAGILAQRLYDAGRIKSRRLGIISDIAPCIFKSSEHTIENLIENYYGGIIMMDLTGSFGNESSEYDAAGRYILTLLKKYRDQCLFIFTYNVDDPGFSYTVLPGLKDCVIPVMLREGSCSRDSAVRYMTQRIIDLGYPEFKDQAEEFLGTVPGDELMMTDLLEAAGRFPAWCLSRNVYTGYDLMPGDGFMLDRNTSGKDAYDGLKSMIGLDIVKKKIDGIIATDLLEKQRRKIRGAGYRSASMHMIFEGNPGSAKTTVARLFAGIAKDRGIIKSGAFAEYGGSDLTGLSSDINIKNAFASARGGVLFIDEAYDIAGDHAITELIRQMENNRDDVIVILAGYKDRMDDFMERNEGLKSRIPYVVDFPDYDADELTDIFRYMTDKEGFTVTEGAVRTAHFIFERMSKITNFGNGRYVRNLVDNAISNQSLRLSREHDDVDCVPKEDLFALTEEDITEPETDLKETRAAGDARRELDEMTGLDGAKEIINKIINHHKLNKALASRGIPVRNASMHMAFTGNPGTAKTTVARLFAQIMKDEGLLSTGTFIEAGRSDLIAGFVGQTALKVKARFQEAQGGVLFIDEAYSLIDDRDNSFGDEAINTIVQEMENHRDNVVVIFAGYPEPMKDLLDKNPGMRSRIAFNVHFEDYSVDELIDIARLMAKRESMSITEEALCRIREIVTEARKEEGYGNGRFIRSLLEEARMNLACRISYDDPDTSTDVFTTIEACDIPDRKSDAGKNKRRIGFEAA